jgi:hypothetical protein
MNITAAALFPGVRDAVMLSDGPPVADDRQ